MANNKPWSGRFKKSTHKIAEKFSSSIHFDKRLYEEDIEGSIAHVKMLAQQNIIPKDEASKIVSGLKKIKKEIETGKFPFREEYEDIHLNIEKRLIEIIGEIGGKVHTARSRNDQIALDTRLYLRKQIKEILRLLTELTEQFVLQAEKNFGTAIPLYTHLQRGQPVLLSHHLLAYFEMLKRDRERLLECYNRVNINPLGVCAGAGTSFNIDRKTTARELGFAEITANSIDTVSDRDYVAEFIFCCSLIMMHLSRLSEEFVLWASKEFDFVDFGDELTTGSSIMPQKRNPDMSELTRGKTARVYGHLVAILTIMKGLPLSYNRDMQEDKEPLFDTIDTVKAVLEINIQLVKAMVFKSENMYKALTSGYLTATDLADYLAKKGLPFRQAHEITGRIVSYAEERGKELEELSLEELKNFSDIIEEDVLDQLSIKGSIESRTSYGGTAPSNVKKMLNRAKREINKWKNFSLK